MKKIAIIFVLGVFIPALVLGVLALQSARQQGVLIADQEAKLRQQEADTLATQIQLAVRIEHESFVKAVQEILESYDPEAAARNFTQMLQLRRPGKGLGFSVSTAGKLYSPSQASAAGTDEAEFIQQNAGFLRGRISAEVYPTVSSESLADVQQSLQQRSKNSGSSWLSTANTYRGESSKKPEGKIVVLNQAYDNLRESSLELKQEVSSSLQSQGNTVTVPNASVPEAPNRKTLEKDSPAGQRESNDYNLSLQENVAQKQSADQMANKEDADKSGDTKAAPASVAAVAAKPEFLDAVPQEKLQEAESAQRGLSELKKSVFNRLDTARNVAPQSVQVNQKEKENTKPMSNLLVANSRFADLVSSENSGILSRFVDDRLEVMFWVRPEKRPDIVFGVRVLPEVFREAIRKVVEEDMPDRSQMVAAVLDDRAKPFARSDTTFTGKWQQPFVASEIGEVLPHWEVGLYLRDAERLGRTARITSLTIMGLIALALGAIAVGGSLVVVDMNRQLALVKKKTDFVSNVSHELKTPLTSIRMFAELLQQDKVPDAEKRSHYLRIITVEAERLTRLINNVLDFARMERNQKTYHKEEIDFYDVIRQVWEGQELHLKQQGFSTAWNADSPPYPVLADADALAQILVNLISNAEKYCGERREVELQSYLIDGQVRVSVLDRGLGIPAGEEKKIFEHFYRAHDSLSSGIQGSGLGLTLAQKIAQDHGGSIVCESRKDGGSRFTLQLPLIKSCSGNTL